MPQASSPIEIEQQGSIALITINNPPVNAASHAVRKALAEALQNIQNDTTVQIIALYGQGRTFIAGADIREFSLPVQPPLLSELCSQVEMSDKPIITILHGTPLGGGLELALASHARIALAGTELGFPEVTLGILPGAGGTQRTPRLIGIPASLSLILSGKRIPAVQALKLGLIDRLVEGEPRTVALIMAQEVLEGKLCTRRTCDLQVMPDDTALEQSRAELSANQPHLFAPHQCVTAISASLTPIAQGLATERALFEKCLTSPQRAGLIHAFFAERIVAKIPEATASPYPITTLGVLGGGTMGSGIATAALLAGLPVILVERNTEALDHGAATIRKNLLGAVARGKLTELEYDIILADRLTPTLDLTDLAAVDLVIEAVFEDLAVKEEIFQKLDRICKPEAILASNTSYLDINKIAAATQRPQTVLGLHFFSPAHVMRLIEVIVAKDTAPETVATGFALAKRLGKIAVRSGVCDGFIGNRILAHYRKAADYLMMDGAMPDQIDQALQNFGFAMGPFAVCDLAGGDISWATRKRQASFRAPQERYVEIPDRLCERGWFGRKTGRGYYLYDKSPPKFNPEIIEIIQNERKKAGITPSNFSDVEIVDYYMTAMIVEAVRVIEDGIALRPIDIDAVFLCGYGFPRHHGGILHYADHIGITKIIDQIHNYAQQDSWFWQVPALLYSMAAEGKCFADMNQSNI